MLNQSQFLREYKTVIVGGGSVGKTYITTQFLMNYFVNEYDPTLDDSYRKQVVIDDEIALVDILDTTGQEEYSAMREQYMRTGEEFLLVYSITSRDSFEETKTFQKQILEFKKKEYWPMILVGNKDDLSSERTVSTEEGEELAKSFGCPFLETSANTRHNIDKAFFDLLRAICIHSKISREEQERETDESNKEAAARPNLTPLKEKS